MSRIPVSTQHAPGAIGPYSQAVISDGLMFTSGQLPIDPVTGQIPDAGIEEMARIVFQNLEAIAKEAGMTLADAVKTTVFLTDLGNFQAVNEVYAQHFKEPYPARSAIQVAALPLGAEIEVEAIFKL